MNRYIELKYEGKLFKENYEINEILIKNKMNWFLDCEIANMRIEITKETLIINSGIFYNGVFEYGVIRDVDWRNGSFDNGVIYNGVFKYIEIDKAIIMGGTFLEGEIVSGDIRGGKYIDIDILSSTQVADNIKKSYVKTYENFKKNI